MFYAFAIKATARKSGLPASAMDSSPLIAGLELLFRRYNITTVDELAMLLRQDGNGVADYITSSDNRQAAYKRWSSWQRSQPSANDASTQASVQATTVGTAIDIQLDSRSVAAQTTDIMDMVDVDTAERMLAEALSSTSITEMSDASTAAYVQHSDASCDPVEWISSDFAVQVTPAPLVHRQVQAGSECVSRFDATVQTDIGQDDLDLVLIGSGPWDAVVLPQIRRELQLVG